MKKSSIFLFIIFVFIFNACIENQFSNASVNLASGYQLYEKNCSNCHQEDGAGLAKLYPPLLNSDFIKNNPLAIDSIIKNGQKGSIKVNGVEYNLAMPAYTKLTQHEVNQITYYVLIKFNKLDSLLVE
jgi:mono/diheme cytochrome c family protein